MRREPVGPAAQQPPDPEQRVVAAAVMAEGFVLDAPADVIDCCEAEAVTCKQSSTRNAPGRLLVARRHSPTARVQDCDRDVIAPRRGR